MANCAVDGVAQTHQAAMVDVNLMERLRSLVEYSTDPGSRPRQVEGYIDSLRAMGNELSPPCASGAEVATASYAYVQTKNSLAQRRHFRLSKHRTYYNRPRDPTQRRGRHTIDRLPAGRLVTTPLSLDEESSRLPTLATNSVTRISNVPFTVSVALVVRERGTERANAADRVVRFRSSQENDHFRLLDHDGDFLLIGAKNMVYNVSAATLSVRRRLEWRPSESDVKMCRLKGKSETACHNYIRVIAKKAHDRVLVCGTNAYKPKCRDYALLPTGPPPAGGSSDQSGQNQRGSGREFSLTEEKPGEGLCPYDPNHNSTFTFA
ncbi:semaphorin-1A-like, partial [Tropilaelaps mercedesae]